MQTTQETAPAALVAVSLPSPTASPAYRFSYTPSLDGLRALAVSLVFLFHSTYRTVLTGGHVGVDVFLVLSGFLITSILASEWSTRHTISLSKFYARRLLRLTPAVLVCVLVVSVCDVWNGLSTWSDVGRYLQALLLYYINVGGYWFHIPVPLGLAHCWSLSLEEQFYLLWPGLLLLMLRRSARTAWLGALWLAGLATVWECWLAYQGVDNVRLYLFLDTRANAVLLGASVALLPWAVGMDTARRWATGLGRYGLVLLGVILLSLRYLPSPGDIRQPMTLPVIVATAGLILIFAFGPASRLRSWFETRPAVALGRLSYSFYLWHLPVLVYFELHLMSRNSRLERGLAELLVSCLFALLSYRLVESPFLRLKQRWRA